MNARLLTPFILLGLILAGCASPSEKAPPASVDDTDPIQREVGAVSTPAGNATTTVDTPLLLSVATGPDAPITAFKWRIPEGAIVKWRPIASIPDFVIEQIIFDMVPVIPNGTAAPSEYALLTFRLDGEAQLATTRIAVPSEGQRINGVTTTNSSLKPSLTPGYLFMSAGSLEEGDEIGLVFVAKSDTPGALGLLLSPRTSRPANDEQAPETAVQLLKGRSPVALTPTGKGAGFQFASYVSNRFSYPPTLSYTEWKSGAISVMDQLPRVPENLATARSVTIDANYDAPGFSRMFGSFNAFMFLPLVPLFEDPCAPIGKYEYQVNLHGTTVNHRSIFAEGALWRAYPVAGWAFASAIGDGSGNSRATMSMQVVDTCGIEFMFYNKLDLGSTLEPLLGVPAATGGSAASGLVGSIPPYVYANSLFVMEDGVHVEYVGWGEAYQALVDSMAAP
jgi:hypothetical protein